MDKQIKTFLRNICEKIQDSAGSVDTIFTSGTSILSENAEQWIGFGTSNVSEIYSHLEDIERGIELNHENLLMAMLEDLLPALEDLAYHSAVFGIYFFSIEEILQLNITKAGISRLPASHLQNIIIKMPDNAEESDNAFLESIVSEAKQAKTAFEDIFFSDVSDYSRQLISLYRLRQLLLCLEIRTSFLKELWWR